MTSELTQELLDNFAKVNGSTHLPQLQAIRLGVQSLGGIKGRKPYVDADEAGDGEWPFVLFFYRSFKFSAVWREFSDDRRNKYSTVVHRFLRVVDDDVTLSQIDSELFTRFVREWLGRVKKKEWALEMGRMILRILEYARKRGLIDELPKAEGLQLRPDPITRNRKYLRSIKVQDLTLSQFHNRYVQRADSKTARQGRHQIREVHQQHVGLCSA